MLITYPRSDNLSVYEPELPIWKPLQNLRGPTTMPVGGKLSLTGLRDDTPNHIGHHGATGVEGVGGAGGRERAWLRCPWAVAGPGRASRRRAGRSSRRGRLAGGPPPTGTPSSPAQQAPGTPVGPQQQAPHQRAQAYKNRHPDRMSACGGARGIRTPDLLIANETRYQLRHSPKDSSSLAPWPAPTQADHRRVRESTKPQARQQFHVPTGPATARAGVR